MLINKAMQKITYFHFVFDNKANEKFISYLEKKITSIIKKEGWQPATIRGIKVKSNMTLRIYLK